MLTEDIGAFFTDGRLCNPIIARCLKLYGFTLEPETKADASKQSGGGHVLRHTASGAGFKLRIGSGLKLDLRPPENSGKGRNYDEKTVIRQQQVIDGYALCFTSELCRKPPMPPQDRVYFISNHTCHEMVRDGILDEQFTAAKKEVAKVRDYLRKRLGEPELSYVAQVAVAASLVAPKPKE